MEKEEDGSYKGVTAEVQDGKTIKITASETGSRRQILETGKDAGPAGLAIWQDEKVENQPEDLYFYDLDQLNEEGRLERTEDKSVYKVLDERGNFSVMQTQKQEWPLYTMIMNGSWLTLQMKREKRSWFILSRSIRMRMGRLFIRKNVL